MKNKSEAWLKLFRAHTAILEAPMAVLGAAVGIGTLWDVRVLGWALFGVLYHFAGYGMNSYVDWAKGFDKDDPNKSHHPLNTGELSPKEAKYGVVASLALLIILGEVLAGFSRIAHVCVVVMLVSGSAYNFLGKYTRFKFIPISIVHTMVFVFPYLVYTQEIGNAGIILSAAFFIHHVFQIMISGDVKDITQDEASLLYDMGARVREVPLRGNVFEAGLTVQLIGYGLSIAQISAAVSLSVIMSGFTYPVLAVIALGSWMFWQTDKVIGDGIYDRGLRVEAMSKKELAGIWMLLASTISIITVNGFLAIVGVSLAYFFPMSKFLWGNWLKPEV